MRVYFIAALAGHQAHARIHRRERHLAMNLTHTAAGLGIAAQQRVPLTDLGRGETFVAAAPLFRCRAKRDEVPPEALQ